jgi:rsbT co-antagonist protein RsbR
VAKTRLAEIINQHESDLLKEWIRLQTEAFGSRNLSESQLNSESRMLLSGIRDALMRGSATDILGAEWSQVRAVLGDLSRQRALNGFSPSETATFVFSLKKPLFSRINSEYEHDAKGLGEEIWVATILLDKLGLYTTETYQKSREEVIARQQQELLELSTPVVELWHSILALPLIGTLDSSRTQIVMQNLLEAIVNKSASIAIIDITGVPTVDTLVAQHLLKTVSAARLMGAECIISGIRPQIAQTIVHLGVEMGTVITKATLADAFQLALRRIGQTISKT